MRVGGWRAERAVGGWRAERAVGGWRERKQLRLDERGWRGSTEGQSTPDTGAERRGSMG